MILRKVSLNRVVLLTAILAVLGGLLLPLLGVGSGPDLMLGAAVMVADFSLIRLLVSRLIRPLGNKAVTLFLILAKFALLVLLVVAVFRQFPIEPLSFAAGATLLLVACVIEAALLGTPVDPYPGAEQAGIDPAADGPDRSSLSS